jgi:hypothetical protein
VRLLHWWLLAGTAVVYFPLAGWMDVALDPHIIAPREGAEKHLLMQPFRSFGSDFAVTSVDPWFGDVADVAGQYDSSSPILLYEDDRALGPAHSSPHADISRLGMGRYSHWKGNYSVFVFSSSDNTDPRTNGRSYWAVRPAKVAP